MQNHFIKMIQVIFLFFSRTFVGFCAYWAIHTWTVALEIFDKSISIRISIKTMKKWAFSGEWIVLGNFIEIGNILNKPMWKKDVIECLWNCREKERKKEQKKMVVKYKMCAKCYERRFDWGRIEQKIWTIAEMSNNDAVNISLPNILTLTMEAVCCCCWCCSLATRWYEYFVRRKTTKYLPKAKAITLNILCVAFALLSLWIACNGYHWYQKLANFFPALSVCVYVFFQKIFHVLLTEHLYPFLQPTKSIKKILIIFNLRCWNSTNLKWKEKHIC